MLTGLELVGIILGVLPLVIEAFDRGKGIWKTNKEFASCRKPIEKLLRELRLQALLLESLLRSLLANIGVQGSMDWRDLFEQLKSDDNRDSIEESMGKQAFDCFEAEVEACAEVLKDITDKMEGLVLPGTDVQDLRSVLNANKGQQWKFHVGRSFRFSFQKTEIENLLLELKESRKNLKELETMPPKSTSSARSTSFKIKKLAASLHEARKYAASLFSVIQKGCTPCTAHHLHDVKFYLEDRFGVWDSLLASPKNGPRYKEELDFKIMFSCATGTTPDNQRHYWYETAIEIIQDQDNHSRSKKLLQATQGPRVGPTYPIITVIPPISDTAAQKPLTYVENLCQVMHGSAIAQEHLRLYLKDVAELYSSPSDTGAAIIQKDIVHLISLKDILLASCATSDRRSKLDTRHRTLLALRLASSLLQLLATPWLGRNWSSTTVCFFMKTSNGHNTGSAVVPMPVQDIALDQVVIERPVLVKRFPPLEPIPSEQEFGANDIKRIFLELGIMMLELHHEMPLERYCSERHYTMRDDYFSRQYFAKLWIDTSRYSVFPDYLTPISQCVDCAFEPRTELPDWRNGAFRQSVCETVIEPLIKYCGAWRLEIPR